MAEGDTVDLRAQAGQLAIPRLITVGKRRGVISLATCADSVTGLVSPFISFVLINSSATVINCNQSSALSVDLSRVVTRAHTIIDDAHRTYIVTSVPFNDCRRSPRRTCHGYTRILTHANYSTVGLRNNTILTRAIRFLIRHNVPIVTRVNLVPRCIGTVNNFGTRNVGSAATQTVRTSTHTRLRTNTFDLLLRNITRKITHGIARFSPVPAVNVNTSLTYSNRILIARSVLKLNNSRIPHFIGRCTSINTLVDRTYRRFTTRIHSNAFPRPGRYCNIG